MPPAKKQDETLTLVSKCWFYVEPKKLTEHNCSLASFIRSRLPKKEPRWEVSAIQDWKIADVKADKVFVPLEIQFKISQCCTKHTKKPDQELFDELWNFIRECLNAPECRSALGLDKTTAMICRSLSAVGRHNGTGDLSRWVLPTPKEPIELPAERIEQALYNLVQIKIRKKDPRHSKSCSGAAVFDCAETELYRQKLEHDHLMVLVNNLALQDESDKKTINACVKRIEDLDMALVTLLDVIKSATVGGPAPSKCRLRKLFRFMRRKKAVCIDSKVVEGLKKKATTDLETLERVAPLLAGHVRLHDPERWQGVQRVCENAEEGIEKDSMAHKMAIYPAKLHVAKMRTANFVLVRDEFEHFYGTAVAGIEALIKGMSQAHYDAEANKSSAKVARGGQCRTCKFADAAKEQAIAAKVDEYMDEKL